MRKKMSISNTRCPSTLTPGVVFSQSLDHMGRVFTPLVLHFIRPCTWYTQEEIKSGIPPKEKLPTLLWISGGGFQTTAPLKYAPEFNYLVEKGYQVALIDYRVSGEAPFPAAVQDVKTAVRFLRANADKYGVDENRIAVIGDSAGGYLSAMVGVTSETDLFDTSEWSGFDSSVKAVVDLYGVVDLISLETNPLPVYQGHVLTPVRKFLGDKGMNSVQIQQIANPVNYLSEKTPPFLIIHGTADQLVPHEQSEHFYDALVEKGVPVDFYSLEGAEHAGNEFWQEPVKDIISSFLDTYV